MNKAKFKVLPKELENLMSLLIETVKPIVAKLKLENSDYLTIAKAVHSASLSAIQFHQARSAFGSWGGKGPLAPLFQSYLSDLVKSQKITSEQLKEIQSPPKQTPKPVVPQPTPSSAHFGRV